MYLERKYLFSGKLEGNLIKSLKNQVPDRELLESPSTLKSIQDEVEIHFGRKSNEIEALSIYRDELMLIEEMNKRKPAQSDFPL